MSNSINSTDRAIGSRPDVSLGRLVVIDDEPAVARLLARIAESAGYEVSVCTEAGRVAELLSGTCPNVVTLDLNMPGTDGIEMLRTLAAATGHGVQTSVILVSGVDARLLEMTARLGREMGLHIAGVIAKPLNLDEYRATLANCRSLASTLVDSHGAGRFLSEADLRSAIREGRIFVRLQPQVSLSTLEIVGAEALVRLNHPTWGEVSPAWFIPIAETSGLIGELTRVVIDRTLSLAAGWLAENPKCQLSINLSPSLLGDLKLPDRISEQVASYFVRPEQITLEITETATAPDYLRSMEILGRLRLRGFQLSIDDFGTGSSTLTQLHDLPFNELKIDRTFVLGASRDEGAATIVRSLVALGHEMDLRVVAEGIEDAETLYWLKSLGCDAGQGYYLCRPLDGPGFLRWAGEYAAAGCFVDPETQPQYAVL